MAGTKLARYATQWWLVDDRLLDECNGRRYSMSGLIYVKTAISDTFACIIIKETVGTCNETHRVQTPNVLEVLPPVATSNDDQRVLHRVGRITPAWGG